MLPYCSFNATESAVDESQETLEEPIVLAKPAFLRHIHYFRAVAILFVVVSHVILVPCLHTSFQEPVHAVCFLFFTNATVFFVLISGFLFQHINDNPGFRYGRLMKKKFLNVYLPMLVMSLPAMLLYFAYADQVRSLLGAPAVERSVAEEVLGGLFALVAGLWLGPYWYIPFIMMVFAISPLILRFIRWRYSLGLTLATIPLGFFFFPRTFDLWPAVIPYFLPLFVLGAILSYRYDSIQGHIERGLLVYGILALACMVVCFLVPHQEPTYAGIFNVSPRAGVHSVVSGWFKVFLAMFFWGLLIKCEHREFKLLDRIAAYSFGIYFIHSYFLNLGLFHYNNLWPPPGGLSLLVTLAYCILVPLLSLAIAMLIKRVFRRYARYVAGV